MCYLTTYTCVSVYYEYYYYTLLLLFVYREAGLREREREISLFARVTSTATDDSAVTKYIYHAKPAIFEQDVTR